MAPIDIKRLREQSSLGNLGSVSFGTFPDLAPQNVFTGLPPEQAPINISVSDANPKVDYESGIFEELPRFQEDVQVTAPTPAPQTTSPQAASPQAAEQPSIADLWNQINQIYTPETISRTRLDELLANIPERQSPGIARRLVASGMGVRAKDPLETMEGVMYAPHARAMADWKERAGPFQQAAQLENTTNVNARTLVGNLISADTQARRIAETARVADERNRIQEQRVADQREIGLINANVNKAKLEGGNIEVDPGTGQVIATYTAGPKAGTYEILGKVPDSTTAAELAHIRGKYQIAAAQQRAESSLANIQAAGGVVFIGPDGQPYVVNPRTPEKPAVPVQGPPPGEIQKPRTVPTGANQPSPAILQGVRNQAQEALTELRGLLDEKGEKLRPNVQTAVGKSRMAGLQYIPGSDTLGADVAIKRLKDLLTISLIGEMKAQSRTGATGFGALNMRELGVLESAANKLNPLMGEEAFTAELKRIEERLNKILQPADVFTPTVTETTPTIPPKYQRNPDTGEIRVSRDGGKTWSKYEVGK